MDLVNELDHIADAGAPLSHSASSSSGAGSASTHIGSSGAVAIQEIKSEVNEGAYEEGDENDFDEHGHGRGQAPRRTPERRVVGVVGAALRIWQDRLTCCHRRPVQSMHNPWSNNALVVADNERVAAASSAVPH